MIFLRDYKMQTASSVLIATDDQWWQVGSITSAQTGFTFSLKRINNPSRDLALAIRLINYLYLVIFQLYICS